ncbi:MAG: response regulator transcription factor, partial [Lachnospiraceae bacterium]|nr:response regulator transcription factor [Lachnospiraceae bacterium]
MRVAICDNEKECIEYLRKMLETNPLISSIYEVNDKVDLDNIIDAREQFDIVFMDIDWDHLPKNGINYASEIHNGAPVTQIIYVTGYNDRFSQDVFMEEVNLCGYLVKPVEEERLKFLVEKAYNNIQFFETDTLLLESKKGSYALPYRAIRYAESKTHQVIIHMGREEYVFYEKLEALKKRFPKYYVHCHKSYLVNMNEVRRIEGYELVLRDDSRIPISKLRYQAV